MYCSLDLLALTCHESWPTPPHGLPSNGGSKTRKGMDVFFSQCMIIIDERVLSSLRKIGPPLPPPPPPLLLMLQRHATDGLADGEITTNGTLVCCFAHDSNHFAMLLPSDFAVAAPRSMQRVGSNISLQPSIRLPRPELHYCARCMLAWSPF